MRREKREGGMEGERKIDVLRHISPVISSHNYLQITENGITMFCLAYLGFIIELMSLLCVNICLHRGA